MKRALVIVSLLFFSSVVAFGQAPTPPDDLVRKVTDRIIELIQKNRAEYARDYRKLYEMVDREVLPYFDFAVMARSVLGRHWREASAEQRERFVKEFRDLLVRTYAVALLKYTDEQVRILPLRAKPEDKRVLVRTEVISGGGGPNIPIHYSFYRSDAGWKVYDVAVENVSLVTNYRSVYAERIRAQGLDALIATVAEDNRRGRTSGSAPGEPRATGR